MTTVHHINAAPPGSIYIGRAMPGRFAASTWANPHKLTQDTESARLEALRNYFATIYSNGLFYRVATLRNKALACWCHPKLCHGDLLAELANACDYHGEPCAACKTPLTTTLILSAGDIKPRIYCPKCRATRYGNPRRIKIFEEKQFALDIAR